MLEVEAKWLAYARAVSTDADHLEKCIAAGGARPIQPEPFAQLRWPGYIGDKYARILCLGMIHNGDMLYAGRSATLAESESKHKREKSVLDLEPTFLGWIAGRVAPDAYLKAMRDVYVSALPFWDPWKRLSPILRHFGYEDTSKRLGAIAYSNIAKCWSDTRDEKRKDKRVMECCNQWEAGSTLALIHAIRPVCILTATSNPGLSESALPILEDGRKPDVWSFHYRRGSIDYNGDSLPRDEWASRAAEIYFNRMRTIATSVDSAVVTQRDSGSCETGSRSLDIDSVSERLRQFASERDWDQFHSPKNLASALVVEAGELLEQFQWLSEEQSRQIPDDQLAMERVAAELADVLIYAIRLSGILGISLPKAIEGKIVQNSIKYPVEKSRGNAKKYTDL